MFHPEDSSWVGPGYNFTPASPPTHAVGKSGGRTSRHSSVGTYYFSTQVSQDPGYAAKHHPSRRCIKRHVHTSAT